MNALIFGAEAPNGWLLPGDVNEVYWGSAAFLIIFALFLWKGWPAARNALHNRSQQIEDDLAAAESAKAEAAERRAEQEKAYANVDDEAAAIVAEGRTRADALRVDLRQRAETEVEAAKQRAHLEIEAAKTQAMADIRADVAARTVEAAEAVVDNSLDAGAHERLIDQYIDQVGASA